MHPCLFGEPEFLKIFFFFFCLKQHYVNHVIRFIVFMRPCLSGWALIFEDIFLSKTALRESSDQVYWFYASLFIRCAQVFEDFFCLKQHYVNHVIRFIVFMHPCLLVAPKFLKMLLSKTALRESCNQVYCIINKNHLNPVLKILTMKT